MEKHPNLNISEDQTVWSLRAWWYLCMILYPRITLPIRASFCVLLRLLNSSISGDWRTWINWIISTVMTITLFLFVIVFQCSPLRYCWNHIYSDEGYTASTFIPCRGQFFTSVRGLTPSPSYAISEFPKVIGCAATRRVLKTRRFPDGET